MASYTMELRKVCDIYTREEVESWFSSYNLDDFLTEEQITTITTAGMWTKQKLAKNIVDHYYMREIGFETPYLFRHFAITRMNEIMERKLPLIYSKSIEYNPLVNVDFTEQYTKNITGTNTNTQTASGGETITDTQAINDSTTENETGSNSSTDNETGSNSSTENRSSNGTSQSASTNNSSSLNVNSDTPQGQITKENILAGNYASSTSANENTSAINDSTNTTSQNAGTLSSESEIERSNESEMEREKTITGTSQRAGNISKSNENEIESSGSNTHAEMFTRTMRGNSGSITTVQHLIQQYRDIIVGVNEEIINELNSLFIGLF